jgi:four helix bundle protein
MAIRSYRDLKVWQRSMALAESVYRVTSVFPREEQFGLTAQARRAAVSIPANIAEGYGRESTASYVNFLRIAQGSLKELETHLILASRIAFATAASIDPLLEETDQIGRMLRSLIRSLRPLPTP